MMDTTEIYILVTVYVTVTLFQGHGMQESENLCASYLLKLSVGKHGTGHAVEICWFDEYHTYCILSIRIQGR